MAKLLWSDLEKPLSADVQSVINGFGFEKMTPVQVGHNNSDNDAKKI